MPISARRAFAGDAGASVPPSDFYPVLTEAWLPSHGLMERLPEAALVTGYLYDWHELPDTRDGAWYVGVVSEDLARHSA